MSAIARRLGQGLRALLAFATSPEFDLAQRYLTEREFVAFQRLSQADQLHSLNVLRTVLRAEPNAPPALTAAALLHDVGKSRYHLRVWQKTLAVLMLRLAPAFSEKLGQGERLDIWLAPFVVHKLHSEWGGELLRECGADTVVVWLAENHHKDAAHFKEHEHVSLLIALQAADSAC